MTTRSILLAAAVIGSACATSNSAGAGADPTGVWIDHTGRGAVEITHCGAALCGHVVWLKSATHSDQCGRQIIGNAKPSGDTWEGGWIYSPDDDRRYSLELKPIGSNKLQVVGYMGSKLFSETMTWKRPTTDLPRCDGARTAAAKPPAIAAKPLGEVAAVAPPPPPPMLPPALPPALGEPQSVGPPPTATAPATPLPEQAAAVPPTAAPPASTATAAPEKAGVRRAPTVDADDDSDSLELKRIRGKNGKADRCFVRLDSFKVEIPCL